MHIYGDMFTVWARAVLRRSCAFALLRITPLLVAPALTHHPVVPPPQAMLDKASAAAMPTEEIMRVCLTRVGVKHLQDVANKTGGGGGAGAAIKEED